MQLTLVHKEEGYRLTVEVEEGVDTATDFEAIVLDPTGNMHVIVRRDAFEIEMPAAALATMNPAAFATYFDTWAGPVTAALVPFSTKRKGVTVTRYRWQAANGQACGGFRAPFSTVDGALRAIERHACFAGGVKVEA